MPRVRANICVAVLCKSNVLPHVWTRSLLMRLGPPCFGGGGNVCEIGAYIRHVSDVI